MTPRRFTSAPPALRSEEGQTPLDAKMSPGRKANAKRRRRRASARRINGKGNAAFLARCAEHAACHKLMRIRTNLSVGGLPPADVV